MGDEVLLKNDGRFYKKEVNDWIAGVDISKSEKTLNKIIKNDPTSSTSNPENVMLLKTEKNMVVKSSKMKKEFGKVFLRLKEYSSSIHIINENFLKEFKEICKVPSEYDFDSQEDEKVVQILDEDDVNIPDGLSSRKE